MFEKEKKIIEKHARNRRLVPTPEETLLVTDPNFAKRPDLIKKAERAVKRSRK